MEEGKDSNGTWFGATERSPSMYIRMRVLPWSNTFVSVGAGWDQFQAPFGEPMSVLLVQLGKMEEGKIATAGTVWLRDFNAKCV
jgi:hypothetical protein